MLCTSVRSNILLSFRGSFGHRIYRELHFSSLDRTFIFYCNSSPITKALFLKQRCFIHGCISYVRKGWETWGLSTWEGWEVTSMCAKIWSAEVRIGLGSLQQQDEGQWAKTATQKVPHKCAKELLHREGDGALEQAVESSSLQTFWDLPGWFPVQPAVRNLL